MLAIFINIPRHGDRHVDRKNIRSYAVCSNRRQFCRVGTGAVAEAAEREVVAPVAPAAERLEVAQLAEQQRRPQCGNDRERRELERNWSAPRRQYNEWSGQHK